MNRWMDLRLVLTATLFFAIGLFLAAHLTPARAEPSPAAQEVHGGGFSGTDGALVVKSGPQTSIVILRGNKVWKLDANQTQSGANKVWAVIE